FDVRFLAGRLVDATTWVDEHPVIAGLPVGYFGASTGAAASLIGAARRRDRIAAVVSRGGRPDLAGMALGRVRCPTLLIVGGSDRVVLGLNQEALRRLGSPVKELVIVPGATHLFEEPGALDEVARLAAEWFTLHLAGQARAEESTS